MGTSARIVRAPVAIWTQDETGQEAVMVFEDVYGDLSIDHDITEDPSLGTFGRFAGVRSSHLRIEGSFEQMRYARGPEGPARPDSSAELSAPNPALPEAR